MLTISSVAVSPLPPQAPTVTRVQPMTPTRVSDNVAPENQGVAAPVAPAGEGSRAQAAYAPSSLPPVNPTGEAPRVNHFNNTATPERIGDGAVVAAVLSQAAVAQAVQSRGAARSGGEALGGAAATQAAALERAQNPEAAHASANVGASASANANANRADAQRADAQQQAQARAERQRFRGELPEEVKDRAMKAMDATINDLLPNMWSASRAAVDMLIGEEARTAAAARAEALLGHPSPSPDRAGEVAENYHRTSNLPEPQTAGRNINQLV